MEIAIGQRFVSSFQEFGRVPLIHYRENTSLHIAYIKSATTHLAAENGSCLVNLG